MNPLCACGCGHEVRSPGNKWIIGHCGKRKLSDADVVKIKKLLGKVSQYRLAERFGVSQATIAKFSWADGYNDRARQHPRYSGDIWRKEDIQALQERKAWRKGKRIRKQINRALRNPSLLASLNEESKPGKTSQT